MDIDASMIETPRAPHVRITGRACSLCRENAALALIFNFRGLLETRITYCGSCVSRIVAIMQQSRDCVINLTLDHGGNGANMGTAQG